MKVLISTLALLAIATPAYAAVPVPEPGGIGAVGVIGALIALKVLRKK
jgi:hypothetical protein